MPVILCSPMHRVWGNFTVSENYGLAAKHGRKLAPHFAMEVHLHMSAAYPLEPWLEHFEWLNPLFNEQLELRDGRMWVSDRHGLGFSISEQTRRWTQLTCEFGKRP